MRDRRHRWVSTVLASVLGLLCAACGGGGGGGGVGSLPAPAADAMIAGRLTVTIPGGGTVLEAEPNNTPDTAHRLGSIDAGDRIVVHGHCDAVTDAFDGYHLEASARVRVTATLQFPDGGGNDFDMGVFDPVTFNYGDVFLASTAPEVGTFYAKGPFDLVVSAFSGSGDYVLTIEVTQAVQSIPEREPSAGALGALYLGEMRIGDMVTVHGDADSVGDPADGVSVTVPDGMRLTASVAFPAGSDFDLRISDITTTYTSPPVLALFDSAANNPEAGFVDIPGGRMLWIEVVAFDGSGAWSLSLQAAGSPLQSKTAFASGDARVAPVALESEVWKSGPGGAPYARIEHDLVVGDVLLRVEEPHEAAASALHALAPDATTVRGDPEGRGRVRLRAPGTLDAPDARRWTFARASAMAGRPGVVYAEPNFRVQAYAQPDDEHYNLQWHYEMINLEAAWDITTGDADVIVAVLDTGIASHSDLNPRVMAGYDAISDLSTAGDGDGFDADATDPGTKTNADGTSGFHGTHVAGTIGAATNNGRGVAGVTWATRLMPIRVLGFGGGSNADIATAIRYAAGLPNATGALPTERADIINMSLGGGAFSQAMQDAVTAARSQGVTIIAAAGNDNTSAPSYPAAYAGVISVAAVGPTAARAPYSNFGSTIDLAAPGGDVSQDRDGDGYSDGVLSPLLDDGVSPAGEIYKFYQGTSMAAPHVAGVAALLLAVDPGLTPSQVESLLKTTALDLGAPGRDDLYGEGLIDAHAALRAAAGLSGGAPDLVLNPSALNFGSSLGQLDAGVQNGGGGLLTIGSTTVVTQDGAPWLSASPFGGGDATRNVDGIRVQVDRTGLADGSYAGRVTVSSDGGTRDLQVLMTVSSTGAAPTALVYVLAVDAETQETVAQVVVDPAVSLEYQLAGLPPGSYLIAAGTDLDGDGFICDEGESCGLYPVVSDPLLVGVEAGEERLGVDFAVGPDETVPATADPARGRRTGFRRLDR